MPETFLQQRLAMLGPAKLCAADQHQLVGDFIERSQQIQLVVSRLEADYNPRLCPTKQR